MQVVLVPSPGPRVREMHLVAAAIAPGEDLRESSNGVQRLVDAGRKTGDKIHERSRLDRERCSRPAALLPASSIWPSSQQRGGMAGEDGGDGARLISNLDDIFYIYIC